MRSPNENLPRNFGPYRLLEALGQGGMGRAFLAEDLKQRRLVVIKRLHPAFLKSRNHVERFVHEAKLGEHVSHASLVLAKQRGWVDREPYLVTAYVFGLPLSEILRKLEQGALEQVSLSIALRIAIDLLSGLHALHQAKHSVTGAPLGLLHRDISSRNVMLGYDGRTRLIDLGISKSQLSTWETAQHAIAGSTDYLAPEQLKGQRPDARSDIYMAATVIWELLAGRKRATGTNQAARLYEVLNAEPQPLRAFRPDLPPALDRALMSAMAQDPLQRPKSAADLLIELLYLRRRYGADHREVGRWLSGSEASKKREPKPPASVRPRYLRVLGLGMMALTLTSTTALVTYRALTPSSKPRVQTPSSKSKRALRPLTELRGRSLGSSIKAP